MTPPTSPYAEFLDLSGEIADLGAAQAVLSWDQETYMPPGGQQARGRQMATLSGLIHRKFTSDEMGNLLERLSGPEPPDEIDQCLAVERAMWEYRRAVRVPEELVRETARAQSDSVACWTEARPRNDFRKWLPHLERILDLERRRADCLKDPGQDRYDALLQGYERGATGAEIAAVFDRLRDRVVALVRRIGASDYPVSTSCLDREFDVDRQWDFGLEVLKAMGFDLGKGRQDKSAHPFTTGFHPTDVRLTTRLNARTFATGLFATMHEGGHGLYDQGIRIEDARTPLGGAISLGIHESQSRMWENLVGRSLPFWRGFYSRLQNAFPAELGSVALDVFYRAINRVEPSLIRVEADEVTYSLHIILRFEIERAMLAGELDPAGLPDVWRDKMREYLGLDVPDDKDGCMQDIHWAWGLIGYFPTYTLGNLYSVQFFEQAQSDIPDLDARIEAGELQRLTEWLREKIHRVGLRRLAGELCTDITGRPLEAEPYVRYLETKFGQIYRLA
ncbi:carboxypeptidase M32 [Candidatus Sumerlaeota bacterium]|nr:carboxypeptidase M32 [Candidatus Sumerlaeota bacterium]